MVKAGAGKILVNGVPLTNIRPEILRAKVMEPVSVVGDELISKLDITVKVCGGGYVSQVYAIRQAIAKSILAFYGNTEEAAQQELKNKFISYDRSLLVADSRRCEAKKFGGRGARARRQKSYR